MFLFTNIVVEWWKRHLFINTCGSNVALFFQFSRLYPEDMPLTIDVSKEGITQYRLSIFQTIMKNQGNLNTMHLAFFFRKAKIAHNCGRTFLFCSSFDWLNQ